MKSLLLALIEMYRAIVSPLIGPACRFHPSCSEYASQAVREFGAWTGAGLAFRRLLRCHPFHEGGYDPVPPRGTRVP